MVDNRRSREVDVATLFLVGDGDDVVVLPAVFHEALDPLKELFFGYVVGAGHHLHDVIGRIHKFGTWVTLLK